MTGVLSKATGRSLYSMKSYKLEDHELIVFGDHVNDVNMFQTASHAIAVANAHPQAKSYASHAVGSNEEDSVVQFIQEHYSGRD